MKSHAVETLLLNPLLFYLLYLLTYLLMFLEQVFSVGFNRKLSLFNSIQLQ